MKKVELEDQLNGAGPTTLFAPNDQAFARISIEDLESDPDKLNSPLAYHIVEENIDRLGIEQTESSYTLNGIVHVIDNVFLPKFSGGYCACC